MATEKLTLPSIHLNGTSGEQLLDLNRKAADAVRDAITALYNAYPNARDFYVQGDGAFEKARREHEARVAHLKTVRAELIEITEHVADHQ